MGGHQKSFHMMIRHALETIAKVPFKSNNWRDPVFFPLDNQQTEMSNNDQKQINQTGQLCFKKCLAQIKQLGKQFQRDVRLRERKRKATGWLDVDDGTDASRPYTV